MNPFSIFVSLMNLSSKCRNVMPSIRLSHDVQVVLHELPMFLEESLDKVVSVKKIST